MTRSKLSFPDRSSGHAFREALDDIPDLERLSTRLAQATLGPRGLWPWRMDWCGFATSSQRLKRFRCFPSAAEMLTGFDEQVEEVRSTIADDPPAVLSPGTIRSGVSSELDELRALVGDTRSWIATLEGQERERSGVRAESRV